ncbi:MAG: helix-turn-helix transcriptional regulator [Alphaproteobacteria bacterium]|nr:helix-turn-helix transcriptional regulator [Alphaproteobacteria bacterium]
MKVVRPGQIRAARALLGIKQSDLARAAAVSLATVNNLERGFADPRASTVDALSAALSTVGVDFTEQDGCDSVSMRRVIRPGPGEPTLSAVQLVDVLAPGGLVRPESILFAVMLRSDAGAAGPASTFDVRPGIRFALLIRTASQMYLFDRAALLFDDGPRAAEFASVMISAFQHHADRLLRCSGVLPDTASLADAAALSVIERVPKVPLAHPSDMISEAASWSEVLRRFRDWPEHPMHQLIALMGA